jgi:hypothetical protein
MIEKGDKFYNYKGKVCFVVYKRGDLIKLSYICNPPYIEPWDIEDFMMDLRCKRFISLPKAPITRLNIMEYLIEFELNLIGKTIKDIENTDKWFDKYSVTQTQYNLFRGCAIPILRKVFKFNKTRANSTFDWFWMMYGFKIQGK